MCIVSLGFLSMYTSNDFLGSFGLYKNFLVLQFLHFLPLLYFFVDIVLSYFILFILMSIFVNITYILKSIIYKKLISNYNYVNFMYLDFILHIFYLNS